MIGRTPETGQNKGCAGHLPRSLPTPEAQRVAPASYQARGQAVPTTGSGRRPGRRQGGREFSLAASLAKLPGMSSANAVQGGVDPVRSARRIRPDPRVVGDRGCLPPSLAPGEAARLRVTGSPSNLARIRPVAAPCDVFVTGSDQPSALASGAAAAVTAGPRSPSPLP